MIYKFLITKQTWENNTGDSKFSTEKILIDKDTLEEALCQIHFQYPNYHIDIDWRSDAGNHCRRA